MSVQFFGACERLLSATANGVYQGMLVAALAALAMRLFTRMNATTRHAVCFGLLLFITALIPAHLVFSFLPRATGPVPTIRPVSNAKAVMVPVNSVVTSDGPLVGDPFEWQLDFSDSAGPDSTPSFTGIGFVAENKTRPAVMPAFSKPSAWRFTTAVNLPHSICLGLISAWLIIASIRLGLIARRLLKIRRAKITAHVPTEALQKLFDGLRESLRTKRNVRLRISDAHRTAMVLGFVHPVVILPAQVELGGNGEAEHVLSHELAHVNRRDDWANLAQHLIQAILFFHPAVWWISERLSLDREIACDDHVLEAGGRPRAYALTLANFAGRMNQGRYLLAPGVSNNNSQLQERITMILNAQRNRSPRLAGRWLGVFITATAILAVLFICIAPRLVLAQSTPAALPAPRAASPAMAPAPIALAADMSAAAPEAPDWSETESGPRPKPPLDDDNSPSVSATFRAATPVPAALPVPPAPPTPEARPTPPTPDAPAAPAARKRHMSVEERLDRIERALEELESHGKTKGFYGGSDGMAGHQFSYGLGNSYGLWKNPDAVSNYNRNAEQAQKAMEDAFRAQQAGQRTAEQAMRAMQDAQRAVEASQRALEEDQRAIHDSARARENKNIDSRGPNAFSNAGQIDDQLKALKALRDARESLQSQIQSIERQIRRLEENQKKSRHSDQSDGPDEAPKPPKPARPQTS